MSSIERIEIATEDENLLIVERLDDRDIAIAIMDGEGNEERVRIRASVLRTAFDTIGATS